MRRNTAPKVKPKPTEQFPHVLVAPSNHTRRVLAAYYKYSGEFGNDEDEFPSSNARALNYRIGERDYIALVDGDDLLAVYRIRRHDKILKRLRRWPREFGVLHKVRQDDEGFGDIFDDEDTDTVDEAAPSPASTINLNHPAPVE